MLSKNPSDSTESAKQIFEIGIVFIVQMAGGLQCQLQ